MVTVRGLGGHGRARRAGRRRVLLAGAVLALLPLLNAPTVSASLPMHASVPAYFYPSTGSYSAWTRLDASTPSADLAVVNPASGPGTFADPRFARQVADAQRSGLAVIGYVDTSYARRSIAAVEADIDRYYAWYGIDGIFLDQAATRSSSLPYYLELFNNIKARTGRRVVAINPGTTTNESYMAAADIVLTFEGPFSSYRTRVAAAWEASYPAERFWHVVYRASRTEMRRAVYLARDRNIGHLYITPDDVPNPWDTLPPDRYWSDELTRLAG